MPHHNSLARFDSGWTYAASSLFPVSFLRVLRRPLRFKFLVAALLNPALVPAGPRIHQESRLRD